ncbi:uncharacterized protein ACIB01_007783 [Guaruba guarouba]
MMKGSHEEQARRPRTLRSRRSHRTHILTCRQHIRQSRLQSFLLPMPQSRRKVGMLITFARLQAAALAHRLGDVRWNYSCPHSSTRPHFKSKKGTQNALWSNQKHVNPESGLTSRYLLLRRWVLLSRSPKAHRVRQVEREESGRTTGLRHGIILRIITKVSVFHSCQLSPSPKASLKEKRKEIFFPSCCPAGHLTLTPTDGTEEHPSQAAKRILISFLLFPPAASAQRRGAILSPCACYSPVTTRDAELLSEGDRFQTRGCSVLSRRHILPQTLPSKQVSFLTLRSPFLRRGTESSTHGQRLLQRRRSTHSCSAGDCLLRVIFYSLLFSVGTNQKRQLREAVGELSISL